MSERRAVPDARRGGPDWRSELSASSRHRLRARGLQTPTTPRASRSNWTSPRSEPRPRAWRSSLGELPLALTAQACAARAPRLGAERHRLGGTWPPTPARDGWPRAADQDSFEELRALSKSHRGGFAAERHHCTWSATPLPAVAHPRAPTPWASPSCPAAGDPRGAGAPRGLRCGWTPGERGELSAAPATDRGRARGALRWAHIIGQPGHGLYCSPRPPPAALEDAEDLNRFPAPGGSGDRVNQQQRSFLDRAEDLTVPQRGQSRDVLPGCARACT
ncbi:hypothetical protein QJS66_08955 [Kocuria rhizophila]|nr:hypothetical protein QJS66_08955 [Kocuria rhizophila]